MALTKIDDRGLKTPIDLLDNEKIRLGTGNDLSIFHDGTDNLIRAYNVPFRLQTNNDENAIVVNQNGSVELYYNNAKEFQTVENGIELASTTSASGTAQTIYLSPTSVTDRSRSCSIAGVNTDGNNNQALVFKTSAAATPAERLKITSDGRVRVPDNGKFVAGGGDDLEIYHDGHSRIKNNTGALTILADDINVSNNANNEQLATFTVNSSCELFFDHSKKFETTANGVTVSGANGAIKTVGSGEVSINIGSTNAGGAAIYFDGDSNGDWVGSDYSWIRHTTGGDMEVCADNPSGDGHIYLKVANGNENAVVAYANGAVELYYDNVKKIDTDSGGVNIGLGRWDEFENASTNPNLQVSGTDLNGSSQAWIRASADSGAPKIFLANTRSTSAGGHSAVQNGDELGGIFFAGSDGSQFVNGASITAWVHNTPGADDMPGSLYFSTTNDSSASLTLRQKITAYGEFRFNTSGAGGYSETYTLYNHRDTNGWYFNQNSSDTHSGIICRHGRGLSGYDGNMFNFKRNDGTTVGTITIGASATAYNTSSDYRLKENQVTIANASTKVNGPVSSQTALINTLSASFFN